jgi:anti-sigma regulatory factor (Ser/Thr protein kinase)
MREHRQAVVPIADRSAIGEARRTSTQMAALTRLSEAEQGRVPLVVSELATNLHLYAKRGEILLRVLPPDARGIEVLAIDRGPGIDDIQKCMADGFSTGGTRGCGLGAVKRLANQFELRSSQPAGTVVLARVYNHDVSPRLAAICVPVQGESECGDNWEFRDAGETQELAVIDGLGHGPLAAVAARHALEAFSRGPFANPARYLEEAHTAMRTTRGAAVAAAHIDLRQHKVHYAAVGNIAGAILSPANGKGRPLLSHNGIVGVEIRKVQQFEYEFDDGDLLIMHSDGLSMRWQIKDYPGLAFADPAMIAAILHRDCRRERDDATVIVARLPVQ